MNTAPNKKEKNSATAMTVVVDRKKSNGKKRTMTTASGVPSGNADFELDNQQRQEHHQVHIWVGWSVFGRI